MPVAPISNFGYTFGLSPATLSLVYTRELAITINGLPPVIQTLSNWAVQSQEAVFLLNDQIIVVLTDVDDNGNRSQPSDPLSFTVQDDIAPPKPGTPTVLTKRQIS